MSTIQQPWRAHSDAPSNHVKSQTIAPAPVGVSSLALDTLLQSAPNNARAPKEADNSRSGPESHAQLKHELKNLRAHLDRNTVERMMRAPDTKESQTRMQKIDTLLTADSIKSLLSGPDARASAKDLNAIENLFSEHAIDTVLDPIESEQVESYRKYVDAALFNLKAGLMSAAPGSRFEMVRAFSTREQPALTTIQNYMTDLASKSKHLCDIATLVKKHSEALQYAQADDWERGDQYPTGHEKHPMIYSFSNTGESTLDQPSEIRNFVTGRDKLNLTGISRQLNKPLQSVDRLSGESGEIQLKYSRENNASVLVVSGNRGTPALVAKIFGHVKDKDLVT
ncbi:M10 family metallopeptidase C-terminal domain-containing protein [Pseudomonas kitaguniensis]|uniref:M10 family metallopeptidase C-terminal domain-containing protein n=1 Tax=Pseudomonas kitaguniensis TaxID=2607908 RepID=UPI003CFEA5F0